MTMDIIPHGPISLPTDATFVSDADEEIFLLYTRLAALKPPDSSDTGHFHGLGTENPKDDALLVRIELKPPPVTAYDPAPKSEKLNRNIGRRNRRKKREGSGIRFDHGKELEPVVLEYRLFQDITALRSRSGDTGSVLWKTRLCSQLEPALKAISHCYFSIEFLSLILRQLHFPEPTRPGLFDHAKLRQTHVLELGYVALKSPHLHTRHDVFNSSLPEK
jgi:protein N-lysine methyltransferase METTL21D